MLTDGGRDIGPECRLRLVLFCAVTELTWCHAGALAEFFEKRASRSETAEISDPIHRQFRMAKVPFRAPNPCAEKVFLKSVAEHSSNCPTEFPT
jgi:hypothetical protein